jgi:hypothetical protein
MKLVDNDVDARKKRAVVCWANGCAGDFTAAAPNMRAFTVLAHECACAVAAETEKPKLEPVR